MLGAAGCSGMWVGSRVPALQALPASGRGEAAAQVTVAGALGLPGGIHGSRLKHAESGLLSTWYLLDRLILFKEALLFIITSNF